MPAQVPPPARTRINSQVKTQLTISTLFNTSSVALALLYIISLCVILVLIVIIPDVDLKDYQDKSIHSNSNRQYMDDDDDFWDIEELEEFEDDSSDSNIYALEDQLDQNVPTPYFSSTIAKPTFFSQIMVILWKISPWIFSYSLLAAAGAQFYSLYLGIAPGPIQWNIHYWGPIFTKDEFQYGFFFTMLAFERKHMLIYLFIPFIFGMYHTFRNIPILMIESGIPVPQLVKDIRKKLKNFTFLSSLCSKSLVWFGLFTVFSFFFSNQVTIVIIFYIFQLDSLFSSPNPGLKQKIFGILFLHALFFNPSSAFLGTKLRLYVYGWSKEGVALAVQKSYSSTWMFSLQFLLQRYMVDPVVAAEFSKFKSKTDFLAYHQMCPQVIRTGYQYIVGKISSLVRPVVG